MIPYRICFNIAINGGWAMLEMIMTWFFLLDIILGFNTGFYSKGMLVMNRKLIAKNYLKFWFWLDFISTFPYSWIVAGEITEEEEADEEDQMSIFKAT